LKSASRGQRGDRLTVENESRGPASREFAATTAPNPAVFFDSHPYGVEVAGLSDKKLPATCPDRQGVELAGGRLHRHQRRHVTVNFTQVHGAGRAGARGDHAISCGWAAVRPVLLERRREEAA
jgi:hypothetical protein